MAQVSLLCLWATNYATGQTVSMSGEDSWCHAAVLYNFMSNYTPGRACIVDHPIMLIATGKTKLLNEEGT